MPYLPPLFLSSWKFPPALPSLIALCLVHAQALVGETGIGERGMHSAAAAPGPHWTPGAKQAPSSSEIIYSPIGSEYGIEAEDEVSVPLCAPFPSPSASSCCSSETSGRGTTASVRSSSIDHSLIPEGSPYKRYAPRRIEAQFSAGTEVCGPTAGSRSIAIGPPIRFASDAAHVFPNPLGTIEAASCRDSFSPPMPPSSKRKRITEHDPPSRAVQPSSSPSLTWSCHLCCEPNVEGISSCAGCGTSHPS